MANPENAQSITVPCPYDDCDNQITIPADAEEADIIVCRNEQGDSVTGCNRNTEVASVNRNEDGTVSSAQLERLEVDEDWGE